MHYTYFILLPNVKKNHTSACGTAFLFHILYFTTHVVEGSYATSVVVFLITSTLQEYTLSRRMNISLIQQEPCPPINNSLPLK